MILFRTCWYLCVVFLVMLGCASLITVAPGGETFIADVMLTSAVLSVLCGGAAWQIRRKFKKNPDAPIFKSKTVSGIGIGIAAILTLFLLFGVA